MLAHLVAQLLLAALRVAGMAFRRGDLPIQLALRGLELLAHRIELRRRSDRGRRRRRPLGEFADPGLRLLQLGPELRFRRPRGEKVAAGLRLGGVRLLGEPAGVRQILLELRLTGAARGHLARAALLGLAPRLRQLLARLGELGGARLHLVLRAAQLPADRLRFLARRLRVLPQAGQRFRGGLALEEEHHREHGRHHGDDERETDHSPLREGRRD